MCPKAGRLSQAERQPAWLILDKPRVPVSSEPGVHVARRRAGQRLMKGELGRGGRLLSFRGVALVSRILNACQRPTELTLCRFLDLAIPAGGGQNLNPAGPASLQRTRGASLTSCPASCAGGHASPGHSGTLFAQTEFPCLCFSIIILAGGIFPRGSTLRGSAVAVSPPAPSVSSHSALPACLPE